MYPDQWGILPIALDQKYLDEEGFQEIYSQALKTMQIIDGLLRYLRSQRFYPACPACPVKFRRTAQRIYTG
jgi:hypothetical protein